MPPPESFNTNLISRYQALSPAEQLVARYFQDNREEALILSASAIAEIVGTSDATVVRTAKALGYGGLDALRKALAQAMRDAASPASRLARTIEDVGQDPAAALRATLDINQAALEGLREGISPAVFQASIEALTAARRVYIFGIGPSGAMAGYLALELARLGLDTQSLQGTGILLADDIRRFEAGDLLVLFAYGHVYQEVTALLAQADRLGMGKILITDSLGLELGHRVDLVLPAARGRVRMLSMHTATLALIEALIVGVATRRPGESLASLEELGRLRRAFSSGGLD